MRARRPVVFALFLALVASVLVSASVLAATTLQPRSAADMLEPRVAATLPETTSGATSYAPQAPDATPALTPTGSITLTALGTYDSGIGEGGAEIVAFDPDTTRLFVTNGEATQIDIIDISNPSSPSLVSSINETALGGSPNSVAVANGLVAVAVEAASSQALGSVAFFGTDGTAITSVEVGPLPDMLTFNEDGTVLVVANEGEPSDDYLTDPEGSVSVISIPTATSPVTITQDSVTTIGFGAYNTGGPLYGRISGEPIRITGPGSSIAQDVEPEYIAFDASDSAIAYVALQENNALAVVNTETLTITDILGLGLKDHSLPENALDASDEDGAINIASWPLSGMYMPDSIDTYSVGGTTYIVTANEGDGREYETDAGVQYLDEARVEDLILSDVYSDELQAEDNLGRLTVTRAPETLEDPASLRVVHASPDTGAVDVYVNSTDTPVLEGLEFFTATTYLPLPAGTIDFAVITASVELAADSSNAVLAGSAIVEAGKEYTLAAVGTSDDIEASLIEDNLVAPEAGQAHVRVYHFVPDAPAVSVLNQADDTVLVNGLTFPNATSYAAGTIGNAFDLVARDYIDVAAGTYDLNLALSGPPAVVITEITDLELSEGGIYSVFAVGTVADASLTVETDVMASAVPIIQSYGARSFTIWNADTGAVVFDSGSALEQITAARYPDYFNSDNDEVTFDTRSDAKGPEPEAVTIGTVGGSTYAFVGLERIGGIVVYDITNPNNPTFVNYVNTRDFSADVAGDVAPEGIIFIPASESPTGTPLVVAAYELSGTTTVYEVTNTPRANGNTLYLPLVARAESPVSLTLLHNNDGESGLLPTTVEVDGQELEIGGVAAFATVAEREIADATSEGNASIMVYAGDAFLASAALQTSFPITSTEPVFDAIAQSQLPYTAHILGNHEFDYTPDYLARFINGFDGTQPFLSANLDFSGEPSLAELVDEDGLIEGAPVDGNVIGRSMIVEDETTGARFGIVGATTEALSSISSPRDVTASEAAPAVQAEIDRLQNEFGINKIILVSHLQDVDNDRALIRQLRGVDVAVAGGGDDFLVNPTLPVTDQAIPTEEEDVEGDYPLTEQDADGNTVYLVTSVDKYRYLGRLDVTFNPAGRVISVDTADSYPRRVVLSSDLSESLGLSDAVEPDSGLVTQVNEPLQQALDELANDVIANTEILLNVSRDAVRGGESNIGNLVADAFLDSYDRYDDLSGLPERSAANPVVAVQNGGGIRQNAGDTLPRDGQVPGPISRLDTIDVLPFDNTISVVQDVTPADLLAVLDNRGTSGIYQVAGLNLVYDTVVEDGETTYVIDSITLVNPDDSTVPLVTNGAVDPSAPETITVVTNSFVGDREFEANTNQTDLRDGSGARILYEQPLREYLLTFPEQSGVPTIPADDPRYQQGGEGRITIRP